jgi:hypothetical protein
MDNDSGASVWAMASSGQFNYAQAGYIQQNWESQPHHWMQYRECAGCSFVDVRTPFVPALASYTYKVVYDSSIQRLRMYWDTHLIDTTTFNPFQSWTGLVRGEYSGETYDLGDNMPGNPTDHTNLTSIQVQNVVSGWAAPSGLTPNTPPGDYFVSVLSNSSLDIWDSGV